MHRFLIQDRFTGSIIIDTGALESPAPAGAALEALRRWEEEAGEVGIEYVPVSRYNVSARYDVFSADPSGQAMPVLPAGEDGPSLAELERRCRYLTSIRPVRPPLARPRTAA